MKYRVVGALSPSKARSAEAEAASSCEESSWEGSVMACVSYGKIESEARHGEARCGEVLGSGSQQVKDAYDRETSARVVRGYACVCSGHRSTSSSLRYHCGL
jgi:hypothetical protein